MSVPIVNTNVLKRKKLQRHMLGNHKSPSEEREISGVPVRETLRMNRHRNHEEKSDVKNLRRKKSCGACEFSGTSRKYFNIHMTRQHKDLEQLDGNISLNSTIADAKKKEMPPEQTLTEDVLTLKLDLEYWTWPQNKAPPPKVHHPQEGLGTSPNLYTDALGFDQISYTFKTGVHDVFEIT